MILDFSKKTKYKEGIGSERVVKRFAFLPTKLANFESRYVWLESYFSHEKYVQNNNLFKFSFGKWSRSYATID